MKKDNNELKRPSIDLLEKVIGEIEKQKDRKLKISKPENSSPWIFRMFIIIGMILLTALATRVVSISNDDTAIVGTALLLLAVAGFTFSVVIKRMKK